MCTISGGPKPCTWIGDAALMSRSMPSYHSMLEVGVHAALQQDRRAVRARCVSATFASSSSREQHVGVGVVGLVAVEGAEAAAGDAHVGVVDVAVDDEGDVASGTRRWRIALAAWPSVEQVAVAQQRERLRRA